MKNGMIEVPLTRGKVAFVSPCDAERVSALKWHAFCGGKTGIWYAKHGRDPLVLMHRFILDVPDHMHVDHRDHNGLNNTRENLRICTRSQNLGNMRHQRNRTGFRGVYPQSRARSFQAVITVNSRRIHIGSFKTPEAAAHAYDEAALEHFGEFANLNFPEAA